MKRVFHRQRRRAQTAITPRRKPRPLGASLARFASAVAICGALAASVGSAAAATVYWDINGTTPGASGNGSATGTWDAANLFFNTDSDGLDKVLGRAVYGVDVDLPGMLVGKILRSPLPHARIRHVDVSAPAPWPASAPSSPGATRPAAPTASSSTSTPSSATSCPSRPRRSASSGDEVAAVAAVDEDTAAEALALIDVDYEELPAVFDLDDAARAGRTARARRGPRQRAAVVRRGAGDMERGWREAERRHGAAVLDPRCAPVCLEPHQAVASYDPVSGTVTLWASTQMPFQLRAHLADVLGLAEAKVRIVKTTMGAGFGSRMEMHAPDPVPSLLSLASRRPVKIVYSRAEEFQASRFRHPFRFNCRIGLGATAVSRRSRRPRSSTAAPT